jgi:CDP-Glycerol:Poly(glycerophosphate) glycerophosphotransferase
VSHRFPLTARLRTAGGRAVRRLGLLPGGEPDGLGEDAALGDVVLPQRVVVFFPEPPRNGYQLEQWLDVLHDLDQLHGVVVVTQDSRTTAALRQRGNLQVHCVSRTATLDGLVSRGRLALALYVSHHPRNFQMLRYPSLAHVYVGHGDSDKAVSASNQLKAYDRVLVAGQAAEDRILRDLMWMDEGKLLRVGRPQTRVAPTTPRLPGRTTVLYAPTWEGAQPSMAYSSVATHGEELLRSLTDAGIRVVYRPHPRTGANRRTVAAADAALRRLLEEPAARALGSAVDVCGPLDAAFADADLLLTDVSSLAVEWLPTGRPLVVTVPAEAGAVVPPSPLLDAVPRLSASSAGDAAELVRRCIAEDIERAQRAGLVEHYLGDVSDGAALTSFLRACTEVIAARDAEQRRTAGTGR